MQIIQTLKKSKNSQKSIDIYVHICYYIDNKTTAHCDVSLATLHNALPTKTKRVFVYIIIL